MHHRRTTTRLAAIGFALALVLTACGSSSGSGSGSDSSSGEKSTTTAAPGGESSGGGKDLKIEIKGFKFMPEDLEAKVGDTITVTNEDGTPHTATSTDGPSEFDTGDLKEGDSKKIEVSKAGTYEYDCSIHDYMKGTITVS